MPAPFSEMKSNNENVSQRNIGIFTSFSANNGFSNRVHISCSGYYGCPSYFLEQDRKSQDEAMEMEIDRSIHRKRPAGTVVVADHKRFRTENFIGVGQPQSRCKPAQNPNDMTVSFEYEL